jgi:hypothetical protein
MEQGHGIELVGYFWDEDIAWYREIYENLVPKNGQTAEIGVYRGLSLLSLSDIIQEKRIQVYAVDLFERFLMDAPTFDRYGELIRNIHRCGVEDFITILKGDSVVSSGLIDDKSLDFVFLDADHTEGGITRDIEAWEPKVKPGGWLGGHDYANSFWPAVKTVVDARYPNAETREKSYIWLTRVNG